jgi:hypothetical protein
MDRFKRYLVRRYFLRFHMAIMVATATALGLIASKALLMAGLTNVLARYPAAALIASLGFVALTRLWVSYIASGDHRFWDFIDLPDCDLPVDDAFAFGGGDSGGGGASDSFSSSDSSAADAGGHGVGVDFDLGEAVWIVILLAALIAVICGSGIYLIYTAPEVLPEVAFAALMPAVLLKASKGGWIRPVLRAIRIPLGLVLVVAIALGAGVHQYCPGAAKLTQAWGCRADLHPNHPIKHHK